MFEPIMVYCFFHFFPSLLSIKSLSLLHIVFDMLFIADQLKQRFMFRRFFSPYG